jgi:hypothetical protein
MRAARRVVQRVAVRAECARGVAAAGRAWRTAARTWSWWRGGGVQQWGCARTLIFFFCPNFVLGPPGGPPAPP